MDRRVVAAGAKSARSLAYAILLYPMTAPGRQDIVGIKLSTGEELASNLVLMLDQNPGQSEVQGPLLKSHVGHIHPR